MKNTKPTFRVNKSILKIVHKIMLFAILHSSLIAPSQNLITAYMNYKEPRTYKGSVLNDAIAKDIQPLQSQQGLIPNSVRSGNGAYINPNILPHNTVALNHYTVASDITMGFIGVSKDKPLDDSKDNLFKINLTEAPAPQSKVYLTYDLFGAQDYAAVSRSINERFATGGHIVKNQMGWSTQKEEIDPKWLKAGENHILFGIPAGAAYQYQIRNLKIEVDGSKKEEKNSLLVVSGLTVNYSKNDQIYLKGFLRNVGSNSKVYFEDNLVSCNDGEFEGIVTLTEAIKKRKFIFVKAMDDKGLLGQEIISLDNLIEADKFFPIEKTEAAASHLFKARTVDFLQADGAKVTIKDSALLADKVITIKKLRAIDIAPMGSGMINVTKGGGAYRFLPDGTKFEKPVELAIGYDEKLMPKGYTANDIKTFYFNTTSKSWVAVKRDTINTADKMVFSHTTHFTDYVNGIIQTPESPETAGFTPTMMNDIKAADPSSEMTIISPPDASQKGSANISYPIKIPAGRKGMQPQLAVQYSNDGANSWLGQGWNITIPAISIDTRWGTPQLDPDHETEMYMMNGEQLMYPKQNGQDWMPNRHQEIGGLYDTSPIDRTSDLIFTLRKEGSFAIIQRMGNNPAHYYWKVTQPDGIVNWYGGKDGVGVIDNAVIRNASGDVVHWGLYMTEDIFTNNVKYFYDNNPDFQDISSHEMANLSGGQLFQINNIKYTGYQDQDGLYEIDFFAKMPRPDVSINNRLGVKQIEPYLLTSIAVKKVNESYYIRSYGFEFNPNQNKFKKSQLVSVTEFDKDGNEFYKHTFDYYNDLSDEYGNDIYFSAGVEHSICFDDENTPCPDKDKDGVCDASDLCVDVPGPVTNHGCPECPDKDKDGVCDGSDNCPDLPGPASNNGCPVQNENCHEVFFTVPTAPVYKYDSYVYQSGIADLGTSCFVSSDRFYSIKINGTDYSATGDKIFLIHGDNSNPTTSLCPPTPFTIPYDNYYGTRNQFYNTKFPSFIGNTFSSLGIPISNFYNNSRAYSYLFPNTSGSYSTANEASHRFGFYSPNNMTISFIAQQGIAASPDFWLPINIFPIWNVIKTQIQIPVNIQVFANNSSTPIGNYDVSDPVQLGELQSALQAVYPNTTVSYNNTTHYLHIISYNTALTSIQITPTNNNNIPPASYSLHSCNMTFREATASIDKWKDLKLSGKELEYGINRWLADGNELALPIDDITLNNTIDFTNNKNDHSITGLYTLLQKKEQISWRNVKGEKIEDAATISKLNSLYSNDIIGNYNKLNEENRQKETENRKATQQKAIASLEDYNKKREEDNKLALDKLPKSTTPLKAKLASKKNSNANAYHSFYQNLMHNFTIGYTGSHPFGNPGCPGLFNYDLGFTGYIPDFDSTGAILGSSKSHNTNIGGHLSFGIDFEWNEITKNITIGAQYTHGWDDSYSFTALVDINGDGLDDIVYKKGTMSATQIYWKKHTLTRTYNTENQPVVTHAFEAPKMITSINNDIREFYKSDGESNSWNFQLNFGSTGASGFVGYEMNSNHSRSNIYFTDANSDGLMDIEKDGRVYFNRTDTTTGDTPYFEPKSYNTENMLIEAKPVTVELPTFTEVVTPPVYDVVKVWEAPADGRIRIDNTIVNTDPTKEAVATIEMANDPPECYEIVLTMDPDKLINKRYEYDFFLKGYDFHSPTCDYHPSRVTNMAIDGVAFTPPANLYLNHFQNNAETNLCSTCSTLCTTCVPGIPYDMDCLRNTHFLSDFGTWAFGTNGPLNSYVDQYSIRSVDEHLYHAGQKIKTQGGCTTDNIFQYSSFAFAITSPDPGLTTYDSDIEFTDSFVMPSHICSGHENNVFTGNYAEHGVFLGTNNASIQINNTPVSGTYQLVNYNNISDTSTAYPPIMDAIEQFSGGQVIYDHLYNNMTRLYQPLFHPTLTLRVVNPSTPLTSITIDGDTFYFHPCGSSRQAASNDESIPLLNKINTQSGLSNNENIEQENHNNDVARITNQNTCTYTPSDLCLLYGVKLDASNSNAPIVHNITTASTQCNIAEGNLRVQKGDRIYFRVHSISTGNPKVNWDPKVTYVDGVDITKRDQNNLKLYESSYSDGFILSGTTPTVFPGNGTAQISWTPFNVVNPSDQIIYEIVKKPTVDGSNTDYSSIPETQVWSAICPANQTTPVNPPGTVTVSGAVGDVVTTFIFRVRSTSNVDWKAFEWHPKIIFNTSQPLYSGNGNINVAQTKYPIVDYSIYKPYTCDGNYTTVSQGQLGSGLMTIEPNLSSGVFNGNDNGTLHLVVKRNGVLLGSRTIRVVHGNVTILGTAGPIPIGGSTFDPIEIGYYTDDSKRTLFSPVDVSLLQKLQSTSVHIVTLGNGTLLPNSSINLYHKPFQSYGPMYRQWGQFLYNPATTHPGAAVPSLGIRLLNESLLSVTPAQATAIHDMLFNHTNHNFNSTINGIRNADISSDTGASALQSSMLQLSNQLDLANSYPFMMANPSREYDVASNTYLEKWIGMHQENYADAFGARAASLSQAYSFTPDPFTVGTFETGAVGIDRYNEGDGDSVSAGGGGGIGGASGTHSLGGTSRLLTDYVDLNGDRYPDILTEGQVQFTKKTGGLISPLSRGVTGAMNADENGSDGVSASGTFGKSGKKESGGDGAKTPTTGGGHTKTTKPETYNFGKGNASLGISGSFSYGDNYTTHLWVDINSDGLPDIVDRSGNAVGGTVSVQMNMGNNTFSPSFEWGNFQLGSGASENFGGGIGFNYANAAVELGASFGTTKSDTKATLVDINGDGMIDELRGTSSHLLVRFNQGNQFYEYPVSLGALSYKNSGSSFTLGVNGTGTYSLIIPIYLPLFIIPVKVINVSATGSAADSTNRTKKTVTDFDGDNYPDFVEEISPTSVRVYSSRIRRTDMLKSVTNPLGGKFTVDYKVEPVSYDNPNAKWTMSDLVIEDGYDKVNDGKDVYKKHFIYEKGRYDRREREFYGYDTVRTQDYNLDEDNNPTTVYRTSVSVYHNRSYFLNGLLKESYVIKGTNDNAKYSRTENTYEIRELQHENTEISGTVLPDNFDVGGREGRRTAAVLLTKTKTYVYELAPVPQITSEVDVYYDEKARVKAYVNKGNINDPSDDYTSTIKYHTGLPNNMINVPQMLSVSDNSGLKRERTTIVDPYDGTIQSIKARIDSSTEAETQMRYDAYGNLNYIRYPDNVNGEAMTYSYMYDSVYNKYIEYTQDAFGYVSTALYNSDFDKIVETVDMAGNHMLYDYDASGRTKMIVAPKEINNHKYTIRFEYFPIFNNVVNSSYKDCISQSDFTPFAITKHFDVQHPDNDIETVTFIDGLSRLIQIKKDIQLNEGEPQKPDYKENMSVSGKVWFDDLGRAIKKFHPYFEEKDCKQNLIVNEYDSPYYSETQYDETDRPVKTISPSPENNETRTQYSIEAVGGIMALKTKIVIDQNDANQVITETFKNISGKVISTNNIGDTNLRTMFNYNAVGELMEYTDADGLTTKYQYDLLSRKTQVSHPDNGVTTFKYDNANNLLTVQTANLANNASIPVADRFIRYLYEFNRVTDILFPDTPNGLNTSNVHYKYGFSGNQTGKLIYKEDATGTQEYDYGNMGEMTRNTRKVVGPNIPTMVYETNFKYDSWNRLQNMKYPDGEKVAYSYDLGGNLFQMTGEVMGSPYNYVERIDYDYYEQRSYLLYGNKTETFYTYTPSLRRLGNLYVKTSSGDDLFNNRYNYDRVGNVLEIINSAAATSNGMGGQYHQQFKYDKLNRLADAGGEFNGNRAVQEPNGNDYSSSYNLSLTYNNTHGILEKRQDHRKNGDVYPPNTYDNHYEYYPGSHKLKEVTNTSIGSSESFSYDLNGNLIKKAIHEGTRNFLWDESNRLRVVADASGMQHYIYDDKGERVLKANTDQEAVYENGTLVDSSVTINGYTTYPSPFIVTNQLGIYSKHYYAGSQRIVSRIGDQNASEIFGDHGGRTATGGREAFDDKKLKAAQIAELKLMAEKVDRKNIRFKEFKPYTYEEVQQILNDDSQEVQRHQPDPVPQYSLAPLYFYHPDHLGTSTALTDFNGQAYQFFLNLPFGETMAEQRPLTYFHAPYKFNGKELDEETGLYYYGMRYYDPRISIWYSVDPMTENFPAMNPYVYCNQNPVDLTDPKGLYPDPPTMKSMLQIYPHLDRNASIYVIQEIPQRNEWGQIMHIPDPAKRKYQLIQINNGNANSRGKDIYLTETVYCWNSGTRTPGFEYTYNEVDPPASYNIAFIQNTDSVTDQKAYDNAIADIAKTVQQTGEVISISGATSNPNANAVGNHTVNGQPIRETVTALANARANKMISDLKAQGVPDSQIIITPIRTGVPNRNTVITIVKPINVQGIQPSQIKQN